MYLFKYILVEQGCGNKTWNVSNVRAAKCQNLHLCNTKKLFDESLFCLNKGKDELNETKSSFIQCENECFTRRYLDGKLEQGCGNCTDVDCKSCKINFCNTKDIVAKHCWTNNGSTCSAGYYENCFTERTETNEYLNAGCGTCGGNKIKKSCVDCSDFKCNSRNKLKENIFCYEREYNGKEIEGSRPCVQNSCFISTDFVKGN
uniref:Uncharacterized protein n=1 Tax=Meloidogyne enterolobii TaxID=390850 RepID=A0A6V7XY03_MELEN|nr:unnamed protein product [Meloidogyne enterolobii]